MPERGSFDKSTDAGSSLRAMQIVNIGAAVPVNKDFPEVYVEPTFTACRYGRPPPPPAARGRPSRPVNRDKTASQTSSLTEEKVIAG